MGIFGSMIILILCAYALFFLLMKVIGATQREDEHNSIEKAIQKDTDEFNGF